MTTDLFEQITHGGSLDPTPSYPFRSWHWVASESLLTIRVQKGKGVNTRSELDVYQVEEAPAVGWPGWVFLLTNVTDPKQEDTYQTFVGDRDFEAACTCPAGRYGRHECKHVSALRAAVAAGAFGAKQASPDVRDWERESESESEDYEMLINKHTAGGQNRNDEDYNVPTGVYLCQFSGVEEIKAKEGDEVPRLIFNFDIVDGPFRGKKLNTFVRKNLFPGNAKGAKPSHLYKMARSFGVADPMADAGFDTDRFVGNYFTIVAKNEDGKRAWPDSIIPAQQPAGAPSAPPPPAIYPPPPSTAPADDSRWQVWDAQNKSWMTATGKEVRHFLTLPGYSAGSLMVTPAGQQNVLTAAAHGFLVLPSAPDLPPLPDDGGTSDGSNIPF